MKKTILLFAGIGLAAAGILMSCDNYTTTPTASAPAVDTTPQWTATVAFSPSAGVFPSAQSVLLIPSDSTASVYYTTDGSIPTTASTLYKTAVPVNATTTIKAITAKNGSTSVVAAGYFNIAVPTIKPATGTYTSAQSVTLSSTVPTAAIYYTTDGSAPTQSSKLYTAAIPVTSTSTINAVAVVNGTSSTVATSILTIPLTYAPAPGTFTSAQNVKLSTGTAGDTIYYTTDGSTPTSASTLAISPSTAIPVGATTTIKAITAKAGKTSTVYSGTYSITLVTFKPVGGVYTTAQSVALNTIASGTIYYTTDGTVPTSASSVYTAGTPIPVSADDTIKAIVVNGANTSPVYKAFYQFIPWTSGPTYGTVSDAAGKSYKTVVIGTQTWMAENLAYAGSGSTPIGTCYKGNADSCTKYGRLYTWPQAMGVDTSYNAQLLSTSDVKHQGICPTGWHLPSDAEWTILVNYADPAGTTAGSKLKTRTVGWKLNGTTDGNGSDALGFHALPAGDSIGVSNAAGSAAFWWSATESDTTQAWSRGIYYNGSDVARYDYDKSFGYAIRCVKD